MGKEVPYNRKLRLYGDESIELEYLPKVKTDLIDRKILFGLFRSAKKPLKALSKEIRLSREGTIYRINNLINHGIIQRFTAVINLSKLGFKKYLVFFKISPLDKNHEDLLQRTFDSSSEILAAIKMYGEWPLLVEVVAKGSLELRGIIQKINLQLAGKVIDSMVLPVLKEVKLDYVSEAELTHGLEKFKGTAIKNPGGQINELDFSNEFKPDLIDLEIIKLLSRDCRIPLIDISKNVKLSPDSVKKRIKKLEKIGVINGFRLIVNTIPFSPVTWFDSLIKLNPIEKELYEKLVGFLEMHKLVIHLFELGSSKDLRLIVMAKNPREFDDFVQDFILKFPKTIHSMQNLIGVKEYKFKKVPF